MPTYQYACTAWGHRLEAVQSFSDSPLTECPACQGRLRKLFSAVGIVFKGSGFYRTDSRSGSGRNGGSGKSTKELASVSAPSDSSKSDSTKSDSTASTSTSGTSSSGTSSTPTSGTTAAK